jgi:hypothetical protein
LNALKAQREAALKELREAYSNAMGLNEKKPKNQLLATHGSRMDDVYRQAMQQKMGNVGAGQQVSGANGTRDMQQSNEQLFWEGFKKGLGLKEGEEVGQKTRNRRRQAGRYGVYGAGCGEDLSVKFFTHTHKH